MKPAVGVGGGGRAWMDLVAGDEAEVFVSFCFLFLSSSLGPWVTLFGHNLVFIDTAFASFGIMGICFGQSISESFPLSTSSIHGIMAISV